MNVSREDAVEWASWFRSLGDPTRVLILNLLASEARPMTVGEIVDRLDVGQSTVSHHLKILGDVRFILVERVGTTSCWRINEACLDCFPTAAELVMGRLPTHCPMGRTANQQHQEEPMTTEANPLRDEIRRRYAEAATTAASGQQATDGPDDACFGTSLYDDLEGFRNGQGSPASVAATQSPLPI